MATFGERLRAQREREQIALADVAEQTKIRLALLDGLERDDVRYWPAGIFRRSYVRAYARAIHLDPEPVVAEFLSLYPDPSDSLGVNTPLPDDQPEGARPPTRFRFLLGSALAAALPRRRAPAPDAEPYVSFVPELEMADDRESLAPEFPPDLPPAAAGEPPPAPVAAAPAAAVLEAAATADPPPATAHHPALAELADVCAAIACAQHADQLTTLLARAAALVNARGIIVWVWDAERAELRAVLSHGYPEHLRSQLGAVPPDADNALARAFRSRRVDVVAGSSEATGALAVPLLTPSGCGGVLALELRGGEHDAGILAMARILAAQLSTVVG